MSAGVERFVLLAPASIRRAAARRVRGPEERWLLGQSRGVRESYVREVLGAPDPELAQQVWMLRRPDAVRESYISDVLGQ